MTDRHPGREYLRTIYPWGSELLSVLDKGIQKILCSEEKLCTARAEGFLPVSCAFEGIFVAAPFWYSL